MAVCSMVLKMAWYPCTYIVESSPFQVTVLWRPDAPARHYAFNYDAGESSTPQCNPSLSNNILGPQMKALPTQLSINTGSQGWNLEQKGIRFGRQPGPSVRMVRVCIKSLICTKNKRSSSCVCPESSWDLCLHIGRHC
jgi:hypothetical protein